MESLAKYKYALPHDGTWQRDPMVTGVFAPSDKVKKEGEASLAEMMALDARGKPTRRKPKKDGSFGKSQGKPYYVPPIKE